MNVYTAFLRAINVGGTGKLAMTELCKLCEKAGFGSVKTYIQSGNLVFTSKLDEAKAQAALERALAAKMGKAFGAHLRTRAELEAVLAHNPFKKAPPNRVIVFFLNAAPERKVLSGIKAPCGEEIKARGREVFVHYPEGQGVSKLKLPFAKTGTGRNLNTVAKLADMARALEADSD